MKSGLVLAAQVVDFLIAQLEFRDELVGDLELILNVFPFNIHSGLSKYVFTHQPAQKLEH